MSTGAAAVEPEVFAPARLAAVHATGLLDGAVREGWDALTAAAARLLHAPMAFMTLVDETRSFWLSCSGVGATDPADRQNPVETSFCQYVIADLAPFAVDDAANHPRTMHNPAIELMGVRAWLGLPLLDADGVALGSFCVMDTVARQWTDDDVTTLGVLTDAARAQIALVAAVAAERAATDQVRELAHSLQRNLLTMPSPLPGIDLAVRYRPAGREAEVGGDWFDAFPGPDGSLLLSVGDVVGHDHHAAADMAQLRNLLRGIALRGGDRPAALLSRLEEAMAALGLDLLATAVLARVGADPTGDGHRLSWSNAGHPPPVLWHPDGTVRLLDRAGGTMLGVGDRRLRAELACDVPPGGVLLLYTDGLVEQRAEHLDVGLDRLVAAVRTAPVREPGALCDHLLTALAPAVDDDIAMIAVSL